MRTLSTEEIELFDGDESLYYDRILHLTIAELGEVKLNSNMFNPDNRFKYLESKLGREEFLQVILAGNFKGPIGVTENYTGKFDLSLYHAIIGKYVAVFATGEKQPTRFMIYLEGIWELTA